MSVIPIRCAGCRKVLHVAKTSSLFDLRQRELLEYGWTKQAGKATTTGYTRDAQSSRERLWFSPACLQEHTLF